MNKKLIVELIDIIKKNLEIEDVSPESKIEGIGFTSYKFVKFVVEVEITFDFEFDDDLLDFNKFDYVSDLIAYIDSCQRDKYMDY